MISVSLVAINTTSGDSHVFIFSSDLAPEFQTYLPSCLLDVSTWMANGLPNAFRSELPTVSPQIVPPLTSFPSVASLFLDWFRLKTLEVSFTPVFHNHIQSASEFCEQDTDPRTLQPSSSLDWETLSQ